MKLRWRCSVQGCYVEKRVADFAAFNRCFPGGINFTDIDMFLEYRGRFLVGERKEIGASLTVGQQRALERLSSVDGFTAFAVWASPTFDHVVALQRFVGGVAEAVQRCTLPEFQAFLRAWVAEVEAA